MANYKKRHYRVAQRDKALDNEYALSNEENLKNLFILGMLMYSVSVILSFIVGFAIGNHD